MRFTKKIEEYLRQNKLWKIRFDFDKVREEVSKDTPIYITGSFGPQGKSVLKRLLISEGYTKVKEHEAVVNESRHISPADWSSIFKEKNKAYIEEYTKKGIVFDFGRSTLTAKEMREGMYWQEESWK